MAIDAVTSIASIQGAAPTAAPAPTAGDVFHDTFEAALGKVDGLQAGADDALRALGSGDNVDLHGTMIALEKADIALRMTVSVRDKIVAAYEQIMNMAL